jgi:hypothetical protein
MSDGQFDILIAARSEIEASPPGADHFCIFMDSENSNALTLATGDPAVFTVLFHAPEELTISLTGDTDNLDETGLDTATHVLLDSDGAYNLTGMAAPTGAHGKQKKFINISSYVITLKNLFVSDPEKQFLLLGGAGDIPLQPGDSLDVYYDDTPEKWRSA